MIFPTFPGAYLSALRKELDAGTAKVIDASGNAIPWLGVNWEGGPLAPWDHLFTEPVTLGQTDGPWRIGVARYPHGALLPINKDVMPVKTYIAYVISRRPDHEKI